MDIRTHRRPIRSTTRIDPVSDIQLQTMRHHSRRLQSQEKIGGGRIASKRAARLRLEREAERERLTVKDRTPAAIERRMEQLRRRPRRRTPASRLPNPVTVVTTFLANPVQRFWLVCNLACAGFLVGTSMIYLLLILPLMKDILGY